MLKKLTLFIMVLLFSSQSFAQKVDYKSGVITVDGNPVAKVVRIKDKESFCLTGTYELYSLSGVKLVVGSLDNDYAPDQNDNTAYYYRLTFLTTKQEAIFSLSKFGPEKSFAKLIGSGAIVVGDSLSHQKVAELIALKSKNPPMPVVNTALYDMVDRDRSGYMELNTDKTISQNRTIIGMFKDISQDPDLDSYQFMIPSELVVATVNFRGGINAHEFFITTLKDHLTQKIAIPVGKEKILISSVDRNESPLIRVANWLIKMNYL